MKKVLISALCFLFLAGALYIFFLKSDTKQITLLDKYYNKSGIEEISNKKLRSLEAKRESFVIFVYQPACPASSNFEKIVKEFSEKEKISIYKIKFSTIENTNIDACLKFYPTVSIYKDGKVIAYLDAASDKDVKYYKNYNNFKNWFYTYVKKS